MKKLVSIILSFILILSIPVLSFSDWDTGEYNWATAEDIVKESFSDFNVYSIPEVNASFWLPGSFLPVQLTAEDIENDCVASYLTGSEDAFVMLYYTDLNGLSLDPLYNALLQNGNEVKKVTVNGVSAIVQRDFQSGFLFVYFQTAENKIFEVAFFPVYAEPLYDLIISSIQSTTEEKVEEEAVVVPVNPVSGLIHK